MVHQSGPELSMCLLTEDNILKATVIILEKEAMVDNFSIYHEKW